VFAAPPVRHVYDRYGSTSDFVGLSLRLDPFRHRWHAKAEPQADDGAGFFGRRDKFRWWDYATVGLWPAGKHFEPAPLSGSQGNDRLDIRNDIIALQRFAQRRRCDIYLHIHFVRRPLSHQDPSDRVNH
jgi:hypothetical protein